jgi:hypothetical protein
MPARLNVRSTPGQKYREPGTGRRAQVPIWESTVCPHVFFCGLVSRTHLKTKPFVFVDKLDNKTRSTVDRLEFPQGYIPLVFGKC